MASTMASTLDLSRPSEKLGTHSTSVDISRKNSWGRSAEARSVLAPQKRKTFYHRGRGGHGGMAQRFLPLKKFPNPRRTCTVLTPGFGVASPAFEMCM